MQITERPVQLNGSALASALLRLGGWKIRFTGLPARQGVLIVYPHTSNWDFLVGVLAKWAIGIPATFWGKESLFKLPLVGRWMRWIGGLPVDRHSSRGVVGQMADALKAARASDTFMWLALAPEGTRSYRDSWRSGFYHVALAAGVPLGLVCFDYATREVRVDHFIMLTGDRAADMSEIAANMGGTTGKRPDQAAPIRLDT